MASCPGALFVDEIDFLNFHFIPRASHLTSRRQSDCWADLDYHFTGRTGDLCPSNKDI